MSDWRDKAACRGMNPVHGNDPFFDQDGIENPIWDAAARICAPCKVRDQCLTAALRAEEGRATRHGFVGGLSPEQRKRVSLGLPAVPAKVKKPRKERAVPIDQAALTAARVAANNRRKGREEEPCPADTSAPGAATAP